jgi:hypothetical protein
VTYIDELAAQVRSHVPDDLIPDEQPEFLFRLYAVLALVKRESVTNRDVHNAWAAWMTGIDPTHDALIPYEELDKSTQREDSPFVVAIKAVAVSLRAESGPD